MSRTDYRQFLDEQSINSTLDLLKELSYSRKLKILKSLRKQYSSYSINRALNTYSLDYIKLNRVDLNKITNTLKYLCKRSLLDEGLNPN